jgi:hypothetical protein
MSNRSPVTTEDGVPSGSATPLTPGTIVPGLAPYYNIAPGIVFPAPHATSHAAAGTDPIRGPLALQAGTAAPNTAPLKLTSGALLAAPEAGAIEFLADKFYGTITTGGARKELALADAALTSGRIPYTTTNGRLADSVVLQFDPATAGLTLSGNLYANKQGIGTAPPTLGGTKFVVGTSAGSFGGSYAIAHFVDNSLNATVNYQNLNASGYTAFDMFNSAGTKVGTFAWSNAGAGFLPGVLWFMTRTASDLVMGTNTTERLRITAAGDVRVANLTAGKPVYATTAGALTTTPQGAYLAIATKTASYTLTPTDCVIVGDTTSGNIVLTLPTAVGYAGLFFHLKSSSALNALTFATTAGQTVDGATTGPILYPNSIKVVSDGSNWQVL